MASFLPVRAAYFFTTLARTGGVAIVGDAVIGAHEGGEAGEMVVVPVGVKDPRHLVDADPQGGEGVLDAGTRVDEIDPALEADDAPHAGRVDIPTVPFADVHDGEVFAAQALSAQLVCG